MKPTIPRPVRRRLGLALAPFCLLLLAHAGLPEPDTLVFGAVSIGGRPATNDAVVLQARRPVTGQVLAAYRMTSDPRGQEYYALSLERNTAPEPGSLASTTGETVLVALIDNGRVLEQRQILLPAAGQSVRLDLGPSLDLDGNGVPDGWEDLFPTGDLASDLDGDGASKLAEYTAGTNPADASSVFKLTIQPVDVNVQVSFLARVAGGVGYDGRTRYYVLEQRPSLSDLAWEVVSNYHRIPAQNQWVLYSVPLSNAPAFYRARVWLEGP